MKGKEETNRNPISGNGICEAPGWVHGSVWSIFGIVLLALLVLFHLYRSTDIWFLWLGNEPKSQHTFAEAVTPGIFRTRANTWSNLGYVLVGLYIFVLGWWDARRMTTEQDSYAIRQPALIGLFGVACIALGFGSGLMHASMMPIGHKMDVFGMFFSFLAMIGLQWARWFPDFPYGNRRIPSWPFFCLLVVAVSFLLLENAKVLGVTSVLGTLGSLVGLAVGVDAMRRRSSQQYGWLLLALASMAVAGYLQRQDVARRFTPSDSWLQGHAIWHILTALAFGSMAWFYRSEIPRVKTDRNG